MWRLILDKFWYDSYLNLTISAMLRFIPIKELQNSITATKLKIQIVEIAPKTVYIYKPLHLSAHLSTLIIFPKYWLFNVISTFRIYKMFFCLSIDQIFNAIKHQILQSAHHFPFCDRFANWFHKLNSKTLPKSRYLTKPWSLIAETQFVTCYKN